MGKNNARKIALAGGKTLAELKSLVAASLGGAKTSRLNKSLTADHVKEIMTDALNSFPDGYVFKEASYDRGRNMNAGDTLLVTNIIREFG